MRRKHNRASRLLQCGRLLVSDPQAYRGRWLSAAAGDLSVAQPFRELRVELGCGKGRFTVESAKAEPDVLFVALEKNADVLVIALERAVSEGLNNALFILGFADDMTDYFAPEEVSRIYINFCDPWPGNRHLKRRLTCARFLDLYTESLKPGGEILFKTDNLSLFEFSLREFKACGFDMCSVEYDIHSTGLGSVMTDYEAKFHEMGLPILQCIAKRGEKPFPEVYASV